MVVVTGANGFIGSAMVWQLNTLGIQDIVCVDTITLDERPQLLKNKKYSKFFSKDEFLKELSQPWAKKISCVIHMGACSSTTETNWDFLVENNIEYSKKLFNFCGQNQIRYIYASSAAVYGGGEKGFDDTAAPDIYKPLNLYGRSKSEFDVWAIQQKQTPPKWYGLRFFNVYGPNEYFKGAQASVVFKAFHEISKTSELKLFKSHRDDYEDGKQKRDFVYVKDITGWMAELMKENIPSGIYNMGFGTAKTWLDLAEGVFGNMKKPLKINWIDIPANIRNQYQYFTEAKMDKPWQVGLRKPKWSLQDGIKDYVQNYLLNGEVIL